MSEPQKLIGMIGHCNINVSNETDHAISKELIKELANNEDLIIENVSGKSLISQPSISRFIRKANFKSWSSFRNSCTAASEHMRMRRLAYHNKLFKKESKEEIADILFQRTLENLQCTKNSLNIQKLDELVSVFLSADQVIFLGDEHALSIFYTLQLDLIFHGIPTYAFRITNMQKLQASYLTSKSVVLYISIHDKFTNANHIEILEKAKEKGSTLVCLTQDVLPIQSLFQYSYSYGKEGSVNDGYYSLFYLSQVLSELIVSR